MELEHVYLVHHIRELEDGVDDVKFIGVFSSAEKANEAVRSIGIESGFRDFPDGFSVEPHVIDRVGWAEGFSTPG